MRDFRTTFHVRTHDDGWAVYRLGQPHPVETHDVRDQAWGRALDLARQAAPATARLSDAQGRSEAVRRFGPDPIPPERNNPFRYRSGPHETGFALDNLERGPS